MWRPALSGTFSGVVPLRTALPRATFVIPVEQLDALAVDQQVQLFAADVSEGGVQIHVALVDGIDGEAILAIGGNSCSIIMPPRVRKGMPSM